MMKKQQRIKCFDAHDFELCRNLRSLTKVMARTSSVSFDAQRFELCRNWYKIEQERVLPTVSMLMILSFVVMKELELKGCNQIQFRCSRF